MKRKFTFQFLLVNFLVIVILIVGSSLLAQQNMNHITEVHLTQYLQMIESDYLSGENLNDIISKYQSSESILRITFMDSSGNVLADSSADELENHLSRPEFQNLGTAYIRTSDTLGFRMMYLATQLDDNLYLRVSVPLSSVLPFLNDFIGLSIIIGVFTILASYFVVKKMVKNSLKPLHEIKNNLELVSKGNYRDVIPLAVDTEINEIIHQINEISSLISNNITHLNLEKEKSVFLLNHMNQGLCVLTHEGYVTVVNQYLQDIYHLDRSSIIFKDYRFLFREREIQKAIDQAIHSHSGSSVVVAMEASYYSVFVSYMEDSWDHQPGILIIFTDITDIKELEAVKRDFFVNASHELKSPITSIMGSAELISSKMVQDEETILDLSSRIMEESQRMNRLVMDIINLSKYESQDKSFAVEIINFKDVLSEVHRSVDLSIESKGIHWFETSQDILYKANREHILQLMRNLVENAIQYGNPSGKVVATLQEGKNEIEFSVEDDGIGIPVSEQGRVFERFYRVDKARSKKTGGTGLGLAIVKHIALIYNANILMKSEEGVGTKVTVIFPKTGADKS